MEDFYSCISWPIDTLLLGGDLLRAGFVYLQAAAELGGLLVRPWQCTSEDCTSVLGQVIVQGVSSQPPETVLPQ